MSMSEDALATEMLSALDAAEAAVGALDGTVDATDPQALSDAYDAVKVVTDLMKMDIATVLSLQVPQEAAGDVD